jgi:aspartyl-tRNA(Asn)/glutamyl-tRNA(Gln) amidotransferase subunit A
MSWTQDRCGPMAWTAQDVALVLQAIAGFDPRDPTSGRAPVPDYSQALQGDIKGKVIGVPRAFVKSPEMGVQSEVMAGFERALATLESLGAGIADVEIPHLELATFASFVIYACEFFGANMDDIPNFLDVGPLMRIARLCLGAATPSADYLQAQRLRTRYMEDVARVFERVDMLATPGEPTTARAFPPTDGPARLIPQMGPTFAAIFNLTGQPALCVPCGFDSRGLPMSLQLAGRSWDEGTLLRAAHLYQLAARWHGRRPDLMQGQG